MDESTLARDYRLTSNIDLSDLSVDTAWRPIGLGSSFTGTLDGNNKSISNLTLNLAGDPEASDGEQFVGLFSVITGGTIKDLSLISPTVAAGAFVGSLAGKATRSTLTNITAMNVNVTGDRTNEIKVGGIVGYAVNSTGRSLSATGTVAADGPGSEVGGIIGRIDAGPSDGVVEAPGMTLTDVDFSGAVRGNSSIGGVLGAADAPDTNDTKWITISDATSAGTVSTINPFDADNQWNNSVGGLIGIVYDSELSNLHSSATVDVSATEVGGLIGWAGNIRLTDASATGDVTNRVEGDGIWCDTGGLIGWLERAFLMTDQEIVPVSNVRASGDVSCIGGKSIGGLMGYMNGTDLTDGHATGNVTGIGPDAHVVGGISGYTYDSTLSDVSASGDVTSDGDHVGGLVAVAYRSNPAESSVARDVVVNRGQASGSVRGRSFVGGLIGNGEVFEEGAIQVLSSAATGAVKGEEQVGGIAGGGDILLRDVVRTGPITGWVTDDGTPHSANLGFYGGLVGNLSARGLIERAYTTSPITTDIEGFGGVYSIPAYDPASPTVGSMVGVSLGMFSGQSFTAINPTSMRIAGQLPNSQGANAVYKSISELGQLATFDSWNSQDPVIVAGWVSPRTTQVWGICRDVASGLPFLQWQRTTSCSVTPATPTEPNNGGSSGGGSFASSPTPPSQMAATPPSPSGGKGVPSASSGSQSAFRQPPTTQSVANSVTLVSAAVASAAPTRVVRKELSPSIGSAQVVTARLNEAVKLLVTGFTPGASYVVQLKSSGGYVELGTVTANANGQIELPVFRSSRPAETTLAIVANSGKAFYLKVKAASSASRARAGSVKTVRMPLRTNTVGSTSRR